MSENLQNGEVDPNTVSPPDVQAIAILKDLTSVRKKVLSESDKIANARTKAETEADAVAKAKSEVEAIATSLAKIKSEMDNLSETIGTTKKTAEDNTNKITALLKQGEASAEAITGLATKAEDIKITLGKYQEDLTKMTSEYESLKIKTESLLPGATSAGLASSFEQRKKRFIPLQLRWAIVFIFCMATLVTLALLSHSWLIGLTEVTSLETVGVYVLKRLPFAVPLVWLAIFSARHYGYAARLEEDYAYKEVISKAFEGYKRQLADIKPDGDGKSLLTKFCEDVLHILSQPAGRIYEQKQKDITPLNAATEITGSVIPDKK